MLKQSGSTPLQNVSRELNWKSTAVEKYKRKQKDGFAQKEEEEFFWTEDLSLHMLISTLRKHIKPRGGGGGGSREGEWIDVGMYPLKPNDVPKAYANQFGFGILLEPFLLHWESHSHTGEADQIQGEASQDNCSLSESVDGSPNCPRVHALPFKVQHFRLTTQF